METWRGSLKTVSRPCFFSLSMLARKLQSCYNLILRSFFLAGQCKESTWTSGIRLTKNDTNLWSLHILTWKAVRQETGWVYMMDFGYFGWSLRCLRRCLRGRISRSSGGRDRAMGPNGPNGTGNRCIGLGRIGGETWRNMVRAGELVINSESGRLISCQLLGAEWDPSWSEEGCGGWRLPKVEKLQRWRSFSREQFQKTMRFLYSELLASRNVLLDSCRFRLKWHVTSFALKYIYMQNHTKPDYDRDTVTSQVQWTPSWVQKVNGKLCES